MSKTTDLARQVEQVEVEVKAMAAFLTDKGRRLEGLSDTCRDVSSMFKFLGKA